MQAENEEEREKEPGRRAENQTCVPKTTICGNCMASAPTVVKTSCSLLITGIKASMMVLIA